MLRYQIRIKGILSPEYADRFEQSSISTEQDTAESVVTTISGEVIDQAALHGLLNRIRDLGLVLVSIETDRLDNATIDDSPK